MAKLLTFAQALKQSEGGKRHALLGNGFSRAYRNDLFAYDALFAQAKDKLSASAKRAFEALKTTDFEAVMRALKQTVDLVQAYAPKSQKLARKLAADAETLREVLAQAIASSHPDRPNDIRDTEFAACRAFLSHFDNIYTLNYDLLLYWALMHDDGDNRTINCNDGFHQPEDRLAEYVVWEVGDVGSQNVFYLHGALHVFDAGAEVQKYTWCNTGIALVDQIREALAENRYPIYVAEGNSESKMRRIQHSAFLSRAFRSFSSIGGSLFIFGHSLASNDEHALRLIERGTTKSVYVSIYGGPKSVDNRRVIDRAERFLDGREKSRRRNKLDVKFFDAASAQVWG
ncbi:hypothetical protein MELA_00091 [Candidatus Methylomirabilis lanthanidiphila]|uniref:DUF4917 domain-containing protein n=1 Tax=Candidatus Methylomirabilis lanthanidiphila TaxID=2211376 RepID=A0A564ZGQ9_9BACT|nr:DUF4917 family protein [Candidatus Methylomirabilis lanthanidiphila]VUZ83738.1 hypothetical protein MELA_00091 [Candidatus Methylomirabilis lanthanidiphila]